MYSKESLNEVKAELEELTGKIDSFEKRRRENLLRAIKWWRKGNLEEDNVDKFLDYFISFEMLASIKGYKSKYEDKWAMEFSENYSITYKPGGKMTVNEIRNYIMHKPGPEKEDAEKLANEYADAFGREILNAIKKIINESLN
jgi:3-deoxy-D-manno-octulosonate 8-phosphate phosphatase KdsC-like HAD superfamily phosphatase